jgi:hypothetical protein
VFEELELSVNHDAMELDVLGEELLACLSTSGSGVGSGNGLAETVAGAGSGIAAAIHCSSTQARGLRIFLDGRPQSEKLTQEGRYKRRGICTERWIALGKGASGRKGAYERREMTEEVRNQVGPLSGDPVEQTVADARQGTLNGWMVDDLHAHGLARIAEVELKVVVRNARETRKSDRDPSLVEGQEPLAAMGGVRGRNGVGQGTAELFPAADMLI